MEPTPDRINALRGAVQWAVRAIAALLVATGAYLALKRLLFAAGSGKPYVVFRSWTDDLGESNSFYAGVAMVTVGLVLGAVSRGLSRWVVALPPTRCPRCGHARAPGGAGGRCPECGLEWPAGS